MLLALSGLYCAVFLLFFFITNGMPFVMDANESYSSIVHAQSLSEYGISASFGLADEAYGFSRDAHPYVHSHQGNFPRLFAWLIYELGAKDVISQVAITTLTIGLGSFILLYKFIKNITNEALALVVCAIFLTDYVFFVQWQYVTYRVWYTFVFFSQFQLIEYYVRSNKKSTLFFIFINTALFCYGELIFSAFLGIFSLLWIVYRGRASLKLILLCSIAMAAGLVFSISILFIQGIAYLGINNFLLDIVYTFGARNSFDSNAISFGTIAEFYRDNHVVFWENVQSRDSFLSVPVFFKSIFGPFIEIYSPIVFSTFVFICAFALVSSSIASKIIIEVKRLCARIQKFSFLDNVLRYCLAGAGSSVYVTACVDFLSTLYGTVPSLILTIYLAFVATIVTILMANSSLSISLRYVAASIVFYFASIALTLINIGSYKDMWIYSHGFFTVIIYPVAILIAAAGMSWFDFKSTYRNCNDGSEPTANTTLINALWFIGLGTISYAIVFYLSPGYLFSGYTVRFAPFYVFVLDIALGTLLYMCILLVLVSFTRRSNVLARWILALFNILIIVLWFNQQYANIMLFQPGYYDVLSKLNQYPYKNASFIVNTYAAPVAVQTGKWAYIDPVLSRAQIVTVASGKRLLGDKRYLWLADKESNPNYRRPDYYICMIPQDLANRLAIIKDGYAMGCLDFPLVKFASNSHGPESGISLVDYDKRGQKFGLVSWAIVKFNWGSDLGDGLVWQEDQQAR